MSSCKDLDCNYYEKFGTCECFKWCPYCKRETHHINKICTVCHNKNE